MKSFDRAAPGTIINREGIILHVPRRAVVFWDIRPPCIRVAGRDFYEIEPEETRENEHRTDDEKRK